jgi:hypothetical protein
MYVRVVSFGTNWWANELYLVYADGRTLKLTETPAKKEDEADGECTPAVRAA